MVDIENLKASKPPVVGKNTKALDGWRERLLSVIDPKLTYRAIAERSVGFDGRSLAHTTVMAMLTRHGASVNMDTLAAVCDGVGADMTAVVMGAHAVPVDGPDGKAMRTKAGSVVLPVIPVSKAHEWSTEVLHPARWTNVAAWMHNEGEDIPHAFSVDDESMEPELSPGDVVYTKLRNPRAKDIAIVMISGAATPIIRRVERVSSDKIHLAAVNDEFGKQSVSTERCRVLGIVVRVTRDLE